MDTCDVNIASFIARASGMTRSPTDAHLSHRDVMSCGYRAERSMPWMRVMRNAQYGASMRQGLCIAAEERQGAHAHRFPAMGVFNI